MVPPKCTKGPYIPTEAPPLIEIKEARVDPNPPFKSSVPALLCAAKIVSAGPNHLGSFKKYINRATKIELGIHINSGIIFKDIEPISKVRIKSLFLKMNAKRFCATIINNCATPETIKPTRAAKISKTKFSLINLKFLIIFN